MEPVEFGILDQCFENLIGKRETNIDHFIYLQTKPEVVYERLKGRARQGEETIPLVCFLLFVCKVLFVTFITSTRTIFRAFTSCTSSCLLTRSTLAGQCSNIGQPVPR